MPSQSPLPSGPRVLFSYHTRPDYMAPMRLSDQQVNCGPFYEDREEDGRVISRKTPLGSYDIASVVASLPAAQKPELLVVATCATRSNFPRGVAKLGIPTVLILGDTQHQDRPVETVLRYALAEPYTYYLADYMRRHLHYFREAGLKNVHWLPGLYVSEPALGFQEERLEQVAFVGQVGKFHPYRSGLLQRLEAEPGLPVRIGRAPQGTASEVYAKSLVSLNISMNGDSNLRWFEILAAGGLLLTDRLNALGGMDDLLLDDVHYASFGNYAELLERVRHFLAHPAAARAMARRGFDEYWRSHSPARKRQQLLDLVFRGWTDPACNGERDLRARVNRSVQPAHFFNRLRNYQHYQEQQLRGRSLGILFSPGAEPGLTSDVADLCRARVYSLGVAHRGYFARGGVHRAVRVLESVAALPPGAVISSLVISAKESHEPWVAQWCEALRPEELLIEDLPLVSAEQRAAVLVPIERLGWQPVADFPGAFARPALA